MDTLIYKLPADSIETRLASRIRSEILTYKSSQDDTQKLSLARTVKLVNDVIDPSILPKDKHYDGVITEARKYKNSNRPQFQRIGACMIALGILCLAAAIAMTILTLGVGLVPMSILMAGIIAGGSTAAGTGALLGGGFLLFASRQPRLHRALMDFDRLPKPPLPL